MIIIPEKILKDVIDASLRLTVDNYNAAADKATTFLYKIFKGNALGGYDYYDNAVALITRPNDHPRHVETHLFFNRERFTLPTMHISLPSAQTTPDNNGIGFDYMYNSALYNSAEEVTEVTRTRTFSSQYNLVFTSDSTFEVLIMFYWLQAMLIANVHWLELSGLQNVRFAANDIMLNADIAPPNVFARALTVDCQYEITAPQLAGDLTAIGVTFEGTPKEPQP
jgi:hypothetical protein